MGLQSLLILIQAKYVIQKYQIYLNLMDKLCTLFLALQISANNLQLLLMSQIKLLME